MRLFKAEHPEKGIWYFSTQRKCAAYIGVQDIYVSRVVNGKTKNAKGWDIELIEDDNIISKYIDPEK